MDDEGCHDLRRPPHSFSPTGFTVRQVPAIELVSRTDQGVDFRRYVLPQAGHPLGRRAFCPAADGGANTRPVIDWRAIQRELKRRSVTLALLWQGIWCRSRPRACANCRASSTACGTARSAGRRHRAHAARYRGEARLIGAGSWSSMISLSCGLVSSELAAWCWLDARNGRSGRSWRWLGRRAHRCQ
jgi:hypothetical protein